MDFAPFYASPESKVQRQDLIKGLVTPSKVRMNQEGWTMMNIFRFFFSLSDKRRDVKMGAPSSGPAVELSGRPQAVSKAAGGNGRPSEKLPPVDHVVALFQPREAGHSPARGGAIQVDDHVILSHHQLQGTDDVSAKRRGGHCKFYKHDELFLLGFRNYKTTRNCIILLTLR